MTVLSEAISHYKAHRYEAALDLFEQAAAVYGEAVVKINIERCRKAIARTPPTAERAHGELDPATQIMLANAGKLPLSAAERDRLIARWRELTARKSEDAEMKKVNPIPADWPKDLVLAPLPEGPNDFLWNRGRKERLGVAPSSVDSAGLSVVVPTFNRSGILDITLACLVNQATRFPFEVVVADDGSREQIADVVRRYEDKLDIKYVRQKDYGYQLCAVRNLGLRTAKYDFVAILDCDMAPNPGWVDAYVSLLLEDDDVALIGPRKYVDTHGMKAAEFIKDRELIAHLPEVITNNQEAGKTNATVSVDWRLEHFQKTDNLRLCDAPFRLFSGGNVAFARKWLTRAGWFDEEFNHWGGEDNEFGYRLFRQGCFFRAVDGGMAFHQEPPGKENETDRGEGKKVTIKLVREKVPYFYRKLEPLASARPHARPLVSIYIPAYNCADHIVRCVDSALNQTVVDLEVCICNDGSTDNTLEVLALHYGKNPRVRVETQANGGIGKASNRAVRMARGFYIGQLDSDDYLEPDAVELCLKEFIGDRKLACVYTTSRNVGPDGTVIANGYNWPVFSREKLMTAMIAHHFRMFTVRAWWQTGGFDESIVNAVDYDIYLKLSEVGQFLHVNKIGYNRVLHGDNTSIRKKDLQKQNHFAVVNQAFGRQGLSMVKYVALNSDDADCRRYAFQVGGNNPE